MDRIRRHIARQLHHYLTLFPVVVVTGPRQSGKTSFIKEELPDWQYYNLQTPADYSHLTENIDNFFKENGNRCIIDEAQENPSLLPALRDKLNGDKQQKARVVLLGSVNHSFTQKIVKMLGENVKLLEITPFNYKEIKTAGSLDVEKLWLFGGFPKPLTWNEDEHFNWIENFIKNFLQQDTSRYLKTSFNWHNQLELLESIANTNGHAWNASQIAESFDICYHTVNTYTDLLQHFFLARKLPAYQKNNGKRLVKHPKLYIRDSGILHYLLKIKSAESLKNSPLCDCSFKGFVIEQLIQKYTRNSAVPAQTYYYKTSQGYEIDLLIELEGHLKAYKITASKTISENELKSFTRCLDHLNIEKGTVIYLGAENFEINSRIKVWSAEKYL
ncbi:MAG: DUF4143 domain-containing protein [bacterium]